MSIIGKLTFLTPAVKDLMPWLSEVRLQLQKMASWVDVPGSSTTTTYRKLKLLEQLQALLVYLNVAPVSNAQQLTGVTPTGTYSTKVTFTVVNGAITAIVLS